MKEQNELLVSVCCITYNHAPYIRQCLDGILMQKTNFKYEIIIHDDCSTDGTTDVVKEYAENYPGLIIPIIQPVNQYQRGNTSILKEFVYPKSKGKYYAICEGDDYWIDPQKLQKQVDYMELHPECMMTCTRAQLFSSRKNKIVGEQYCRKTDGVLNPIDIINRTGLYIATCSTVFRPCIYDSYPAYCMNCNVGDYPLQITAALKGTIYYFNDAMCVYRIDNAKSWYGQQKFNSIDSARLKVVKGQVEMFEGFCNDNPEYERAFREKISEHICKNMPNRHCLKQDFNIYECLFLSRISCFTFKWKLFYKICKSKIPGLKFLTILIFLRNYRPLKKYYGGSLIRVIDLIFQNKK